MKLTLTALAALTMTTSMAQAGGLDRSGQPIDALFETGGYAELSFGIIAPSIEGTGPNSTFNGLASSGSVGPSYTQLGLAVKTDFSPKFSAALVMDNPFGAAVDYTTAGYALTGSSAHVNTVGLTALGRYKITDAFSVHGGVRYITASGDYTNNLKAYSSTYSAGSDVGYVVGAAFEKPEIALRVALTYASATNFALEGTAGDLTADMPQSVNLDVQTGIAANTLLFGSVRWADWSAATIVDSVEDDLISYDQDVFTYSLGVGRKFSDSFSGGVSFHQTRGGIAFIYHMLPP